MKRNCNGCKALIQESQTSCICLLGKSIKSDKSLYGITVSYKPLEECPKPLTNIKLSEVFCNKT